MIEILIWPNSQGCSQSDRCTHVSSRLRTKSKQNFYLKNNSTHTTTLSKTQLYHAGLDGDRDADLITAGIGFATSVGNRVRRLTLEQGDVWEDLNFGNRPKNAALQNDYDSNFEKRVYGYNFYLYDKHDREVVSLAILGDSAENWRPNQFERGHWGCNTRSNAAGLQPCR